MKRSRNWPTLGALVVLGVAVALVVARASNTIRPDVASGAQTRTSTLAVGSMAPVFRLTTIDGQEYSSDSLKGKTVILFAMFANCADCIPQGQVLSQVQRAYASRGVIVLGVDIVAEESVEALRQYQRVGHITIPLAAYSAKVVQQYHLVQPDMTYVIGRDGVIKHKNMRSLSYPDFQRELNTLQ